MRGDEELWQDIDETISVRYICTNKDLPSHLRIGDISTLVSKKNNRLSVIDQYHTPYYAATTDA
ncbi:Uncharacterised protein [Budvicia aquatica]|uniref:Uncharacterized protein n=1 Tax=Budvicia aquatica TaxID=82979 RepID=A0A485A4W4_9GAMM|nr:Uncharacterised protein [Budvicia aquatica]